MDSDNYNCKIRNFEKV